MSSTDLSRKYLRFCHKSQVFQFTSPPFGLATAPQVFIMIVKEVTLMALTRGIRLHQYLDDWLIRAQSQEEAQVNTQDSGRSDPVLHINVLELKTVSLALQRFKDQCQNQTVGCYGQLNSSSLHKQGGTHLAEMCALLWKIMTWCHYYQITLKTRHFPGCLNVMADLLSRLNQSSQQNGHCIRRCSNRSVTSGSLLV